MAERGQLRRKMRYRRPKDHHPSTASKFSARNPKRFHRVLLLACPLPNLFVRPCVCSYLLSTNNFGPAGQRSDAHNIRSVATHTPHRRLTGGPINPPASKPRSKDRLFLSSLHACTDDKHTPRRWGSMKITRWNAESKHARASIGCPSRSFIHRKLAFFAVRSLLSACAARARGDVHFFCNVVCVCAPTQGTRRALFKLSARPWYSRSILYNPTNETYTKKQVARDKGGTAERQQAGPSLANVVAQRGGWPKALNPLRHPFHIWSKVDSNDTHTLWHIALGGFRCDVVMRVSSAGLRTLYQYSGGSGASSQCQIDEPSEKTVHKTSESDCELAKKTSAQTCGEF